jgi:glycosyltransferase involved in cell wall biosynthesis
MNQISVTVITLNEERNLPRLLDSLDGVADEVIVVDSESKDHTRAVAEARGAC